jgi:hypothetical protein
LSQSAAVSHFRVNEVMPPVWAGRFPDGLCFDAFRDRTATENAALRIPPLPAERNVRAGVVGEICKSIKIRSGSRRFNFKLVPSKTEDGEEEQFRVRFYTCWLSKADKKPLFFNIAQIVELVAALAMGDKSPLIAMFPMLCGAGKPAGKPTKNDGEGELFLSAISFGYGEGEARHRIDIAGAEHFGGSAGLYRVQNKRRWIGQPDGTPQYFSRDELAGMILSLVVNDADALPADPPATSCRRREPEGRETPNLYAVPLQRKQAVSPRPKEEESVARAGRRRGKYKKRNACRSKWSLAACPYANGTMRIEGDRMPDPAWGF